MDNLVFKPLDLASPFAAMGDMTITHQIPDWKNQDQQLNPGTILLSGDSANHWTTGPLWIFSCVCLKQSLSGDAANHICYV